MVPLGSIYSAGDSHNWEKYHQYHPTWLCREVLHFTTNTGWHLGVYPKCLGAQVPKVGDAMWEVGWLMLVGCTCWGWFPCYTGDVWRIFGKEISSRIVLYMEKNQMIFWVEFCCWCCGTMYLGFQWSISILVNVASLLHLAMGSK